MIDDSVIHVNLFLSCRVAIHVIYQVYEGRRKICKSGGGCGCGGWGGGVSIPMPFEGDGFASIPKNEESGSLHLLPPPPFRWPCLSDGVKFTIAVQLDLLND